jgi:hypothetical protein
MTPWSEAEVRALGTRTDVKTAASVLGTSRGAAYDAIKAGKFPVPAFKVGGRWVVPVEPLLQALKLADSERPGRAGAGRQRVLARILAALTKGSTA